MRQTRWGSLAETVFSTAVGFGISWVANMVVLPMFGFKISSSQAFWVGVIFTVISVIRGFLIRRFFNAMKWGHQ